MHLGRLLFAGAAFAATLAFAAPAQAEFATSSVNVRSGPGTGYRIVDVLRTGEEVDVTRRSGGWCYVVKSGPDGWVSCRYLAHDGFDDGFDGGPDVDVSIQFSIPGFSISIGEGGFFPGPIFGEGQVCFYEHVNYGGDRFCMRPGQSRRSLGDWNDTISSIRVIDGAEALVCEHINYRGSCVVVDHSVRNLGFGGNDIISSIRVR